MSKSAKERKTRKNRAAGKQTELTLRSKGLSRQLAAAKQRRPTRVVVNEALGYDEADLECLRLMPWITDLELVVSRRIDLSPVLSLSRLRALSVDQRLTIDLSGLTKLEELYGTWSSAANLAKCANLVAVGLDHFAGELADFQACTRLQHLGLVRPELTSLEGRNRCTDPVLA